MLILSFPTPLLAQDPPPAAEGYKPRIIPRCLPYKIAAGEFVCGYIKLEDWKLVLAADSELFWAREQLRNERAKSADLTLQVGALKEQVDVYEEMKRTLVARNEKLVKDLIALDKKYQNERVDTPWWSIAGWSLAAASTAALAGFIIADQL